MLYANDSEGHLIEAQPGRQGSCPACGSEMVAKCGQIVSWHWAHRSDDCDPWSEPESEWHLAWKRYFLARGAAVEVPLGTHRADVVRPSGQIIELQATYLDAPSIKERESHYGPSMTWIYLVRWDDRLHFGDRGFWWKHGAKSMTTHRRPVWWDFGDRLDRVSLNLVSNEQATRVLGRVITTQSHPLTGAGRMV